MRRRLARRKIPPTGTKAHTVAAQEASSIEPRAEVSTSPLANEVTTLGDGAPSALTTRTLETAKTSRWCTSPRHHGRPKGEQQSTIASDEEQRREPLDWPWAY
jgi:hypothetical protein